MTVINFCCYHCASFKPDKKHKAQCGKDKDVCYNAYFSVINDDATFRKDCTRIDSECREMFGQPMNPASASHKCFERRGTKHESNGNTTLKG